MLCETSDVKNHLINHIIGNTKVHRPLYTQNTCGTIYRVPVQEHCVYMHASGGYSDTRMHASGGGHGDTRMQVHSGLESLRELLKKYPYLLISSKP